MVFQGFLSILLGIPCPAVTEKILELDEQFSWPLTFYGDEARIRCPCEESAEWTRGLFAFRRCGEGGRWMDTDYEACTGMFLESLCNVRTIILYVKSSQVKYLI